jgi:hypothetical protein
MVSLATEPSGAGVFYAAGRVGEKRKMSNASTQDAQEMTDALLKAAADGDVAAVASLLDAGADASAQRADGFTPLILAVFYGHEAVARLLVERGADASARTSLGTTAASWAAARGFRAMTPMLRDAEAARTRADAPAGRTKAVASSSGASASDEVSIFARKARRTESQAASAPSSFPSNAPLNLAQQDAPAPNVSVRSGGRVPAHPSASAFRLGQFLRSWQGSVGVALLLLAFAVSVFALLRGGKSAGVVAPQTPTPAAQAAAPQPAQQLPAPQPSPTLPAEPGPSVMPVTDPAYAAPNTAGQPFYVPPAGPVQSDAPRELMVVSESGTPATEEAGRTKRRTDANANNAAPSSTQDGRREEPPANSDTRSTRNARPSDNEQRPAPPPTSSAPPAPTPQPTPRAKVIQWPPQ